MTDHVQTDMSELVAHQMLELGVVHFNVEKLFEFVSGIMSPVYVDNRKLISFPNARRMIVRSFIDVLNKDIGKSNMDVIAGTATAAIPWASWIAEELDLPLVYVRSAPKGRGMNQQVEGVLEPGQKTVIIEDHVTTGLSSSNVAEAVRTTGAIVHYCVAIFSYGSALAQEKFDACQLKFRSLTDLSVLLNIAHAEQYLNDSEINFIKEWGTETLNIKEWR